MADLDTPGDTGIALLRRVIAASEAAPDFTALTALADRIQAYLEGASQGLTMEQAFGVTSASNGAPWYVTEARERRNRELRTLSSRFGPAGGSVRARALWLRQRILVYAATCWPRDRDAVEMPRRYAGTEKEYLWRAFSASPPPSSERRLRAILSEFQVGNAQAVPVANTGR